MAIDHWPEVWTNSEMTLFCFEGDTPKWSSCTSLPLIQWIEGKENRLDCQYCGGLNKDEALKCEHCGAAFSSKAIGTKLFLKGKLPAAIHILGLKNGSIIEITRKEYGILREYSPNDVVLRFIVRKVVEKKFENLVIIDPCSQDEVEISIILNCEMEFTGDWKAEAEV